MSDKEYLKHQLEISTENEKKISWIIKSLEIDLKELKKEMNIVSIHKEEIKHIEITLDILGKKKIEYDEQINFLKQNI